MDVTITNAGGRIEIVDLRNDLVNNYDVLKDGLRLLTIGNLVRITFIDNSVIEINYFEVELINAGVSVLPRNGSEFFDELNILLGDYGTGAGASSLEDLTDVEITSVANGEVLIYDSALGKWVNTSAPGGGDMFKSVYDTDNDGNVDKAETVQIIVRNSTGATLTKGQIVYLSGATGNRPNAVLSKADAESTSSKTIGWVTANISNNSDGFVAVSGSAHDLDTSAFTAGDALWLSPSVAGGITATMPTQPNHSVFIGYCARSHPNQGRIVFKIQNGYELNELHNILITSVANNEGLFYEAASGLWKNKTISTALGFTPVTDARNIATTAPLSGGGPLTGDLNLSISEATYSQSGYLSSTDWNTFNNKALNYKNTVDTAGYSSTANTVVYTQLIPANKFTQGDIIKVTYRTKKTGTNGNQSIRIYVNSAPDLSGSPVLIGGYTGTSISFLMLQMLRHLVIKNSTSNTEVFVAAGLAQSQDFGTLNGVTNASINWTLDRYFVFTIQQTSATDVNYGSMFLIEKL
jgi:hypothetical protein